MKCPYRITTDRHIIRRQGSGSVDRIIEDTMYGECYEEACPLYDDHTFRKCIRVNNEEEVGGSI